MELGPARATASDPATAAPPLPSPVPATLSTYQIATDIPGHWFAARSCFIGWMELFSGLSLAEGP